MKLLEKNLSDSFFTEKGYILPKYDRAAVAQRTAEAPTWVHLGAGNIFRAFIAQAAQDMLDCGRMDKGIIVITHEAPGAQNVNYDIEAFENKAYGEHLMEELAKLCDGKGGYAIIVGSVQAQTHMEWANAAVEYQKANYPEMHLVADFVESGEDHDTAYTKTQELLKTYSDLTGIMKNGSDLIKAKSIHMKEA